MVIIRDKTGITVKRRIDDIHHVRIGLFEVRYWNKDGRCVRTKDIGKPHDEHTVGELADMLFEVEYRCS